MTDLIKQIEAKIDEMAKNHKYMYFNPIKTANINMPPTTSVDEQFKAGAAALMPLISLLLFQRNAMCGTWPEDNMTKAYDKELLELLNKDNK